MKCVSEFEKVFVCIFQILNLIGPKTEEDVISSLKKDKPSSKKETKKPPSNAVPKAIAKVDVDEILTNDSSLSILDVMKKLNFHKPGENYTTEGYVMTENTKKLLAEHLKITGGKVRTRFPPEPNGILHIGHAKAININFGYAEANGGICFLRFVYILFISVILYIIYVMLGLVESCNKKTVDESTIRNLKIGTVV